MDVVTRLLPQIKPLQVLKSGNIYSLLALDEILFKEHPL